MRTNFFMMSSNTFGLSQLRHRWGWIVSLGVFLVALGTLALSSAILLTIASVTFVGILLILGGVIQTTHALSSQRWGGSFMDLSIGLFNLVVGLIIVSNPGAAAAVLALLIAMFLIVGGCFRIVMAFAIPFHHVFWLALHGLVNLLLGLLILQQWPASGLWLIGLFVGIDMVFNGWSLITLGLAVRKLPTE